tara:strand:- start:535 stop:651 length:117 start_codon:yes stop_codon:yes gene_type:complete
MIPENFIESWRKTVPWQMDEQIEHYWSISAFRCNAKIS